ncbi:MAG TPA: PilX N-terminal domain-containing pilus assembly protein [Steroidobacteraceae bacterium]|nr:PilX N-terminal domain-containing pilus assembly protein [Steroidobacteraceae bacterium]
MQQSARQYPGSQRGAVLVVSLLLLLVMTLLALGASQSTRLQERMAGNQRDSELALQASEQSLRGAERVLAPNGTRLATCLTPAAGCDTYEKAVLPADMAHQPVTWWTTWSRNFTDHIGEVTGTPKFTIEYVGELRDTISEGGSYIVMVREFHRSTARSNGQTDTAEAIVQSTHSRVSFE